MSAGGTLAPWLGPLIGVGANRGVGLLITLLGLLNGVAVLLAFLNKRLRNVERDLPDHASSPSESSLVASGIPESAH